MITPDIALKLDGVCVVRDGKTLLGPLNFTLSSPGITCVLGHNGAGKSLFLKLCHGMFSPTKGQITWQGEVATSSRRTRSLLLQSSPVLRRSVRANIMYPLNVNRTLRTDRIARTDAALKKFRLDDMANLPAARLSGGERQRLGLARAWVSAPSCILLDEPAASLDPVATKEFEALIHDISDAGVKVLLATHDLAQARRVADDVLMFAQGALLCQTDADDFFNRPQLPEIAKFLDGDL